MHHTQILPVGKRFKYSLACFLSSFPAYHKYLSRLILSLLVNMLISYPSIFVNLLFSCRAFLLSPPMKNSKSLLSGAVWSPCHVFYKPLINKKNLPIGKRYKNCLAIFTSSSPAYQEYLSRYRLSQLVNILVVIQ